ncbi:carboxypeptidase M32 [Thermogladius sp. 4427co]|uniref:carboxypeptidase M32 n=1 Tax=Thermogladius sp. 4427co TaxID=3450718 RepID=UPI003F7AD497
MYFTNEIVKEVIEKYRTIWALGHALSLLSWDSETNMPKQGLEERAIARAELSLLVQQLILKPEFVQLVEKASRVEGLNDYERGVVRVLEREIRIMKSIPPKLLAELEKTTQEAMYAWRIAKESNDFSKFQPYLEKIVKLTREKADYLGWREHPYDALLDLYEEGLTSRDVDSILNPLAKELKSILDKVRSLGRFPDKHVLEDEKYDKSWMEKVNHEVLKILGYPLGERARLDVSAHPFTISVGLDDVRITTRYEGFDFKRSLLSTIHEFGHALYELQIDPGLKFTPLAEGASLGIHEGQSRFWENIVGRSKEFIALIYPVLKENLPFISKYTVEEVYLYFNTVRPSLIRTEADEVTYNLHIVVRATLEKQMIEGSVKVSDLPELWNNLMEELVGVRPKTYSEGVLQDIHWSMGSIGYFPTYTLGNLVAAQMKYHIGREFKLEDKIAEGGFEEVKKWLRDKIHRFGRTYTPKDLLKKAFGEEYTVEYFIRYLKEKYLS